MDVGIVDPKAGPYETPGQRANREQKRASDPAVSAFVEASAGSGKTKLLTDRILRLMLGAGGRAAARPERIQCLTFTKAAAAEMALRLQARLGGWVTAEDDALDAELEALDVLPGAAARERARALFAEVLDLPGGMRIGTIHSFCQGLLRRFPLEARISPHFEIAEEVEAAAELRAARDRVVEQAEAADIATVARVLRAQGFDAEVEAIQAVRGRLEGLLGRPEAARSRLIRMAAGCGAASEAELIGEAVAWDGEDALRAAMQRARRGSPTVVDIAEARLDWLAASHEERVARWDEWVFAHLLGGEPRGLGNFPNKKLHDADETIREAVAAEQQRVLALEDLRRAVRCADATEALLRLAAPALEAYAAHKSERGLLDYTDLIGRTSDLLADPGAGWVLYKLDGGIEHLLLDEVQDTAPDQWRIAHRLTEEFFAGASAFEEKGGAEKGGPRTVFAVGDPKQSIYSFQGADPDEFTRSRELMASRVTQTAHTWEDVTLDVSFRSTAPVLALVDAVFAGGAARDGVNDSGGLRHVADRVGMAGRVELWPLAPKPARQVADAGVAVANVAVVSARQRLADEIARRVRGMLDRAEMLPARGRAVSAGDVLILVRRREQFAGAVVRALKAHGVPVAGLDRIKLMDQPAVQDLLAACDAVLLPEDDLVVACVLTSPLGGLSDDSLMDLAMGEGEERREGSLWSALRERAGERAEWGAAWGFLAALAARADYVSPHALLVEALGRLGGRARLLGRLGAEAAEPIDELLGAALAYARQHPPSLQGFVQWFRRSGAEVKREAGGSGGAVRVMTVHGAKGLQAPIVIVPDTTALPKEGRGLAWCEVEGVEVPLWAPNKGLVCGPVRAAREVERVLSLREYNRLLYVALTRAEDRLVVCGWESGRAASSPAWFDMVQAGLAALEVERVPFGAWDGDALVHETAQEVAPRRERALVAGASAALPGWAGVPPHWRPDAAPVEPALPRPLAPSRPEGAGFGPVPQAGSPLAPGERFTRGAAVHALLQHLPAVPEAGREAAASAYLARTGLGAADQAALHDQVRAVLAHPALGALFGPGSRAEQPLSALVGPVGSQVVVTGVVDRMVVLPDAVLVADFKTGRAAPARVEDTPVRYVRQLAAYRAVLARLYPDRPVRCALVWTEGAAAVELPAELLDAHGPG